MNIVVCGDSHIGSVFKMGGANGSGGNTRIDDYEKTLNYLVDHAIDTNADAFIQTGDIFESRDPTLEDMKIVDRALKKLSNAGILSVIIMGNHDLHRMGDTFSSSITSLSSGEFPNVRLVLEPQNIFFTNARGEKVNIFLIPFRHRDMYEGENIKDKSRNFNKHLSDILGEIDNDAPIIAIGHNFFYEGNSGAYGESEVLAHPNTFLECDLVVMGHQHQFRVIKKADPTMLYVGSMEKQNFGEAEHDKFFLDYCVESKKVRVKKTPVRELLLKTIDLSEADLHNYEEIIINEVAELDTKDKIVKIIFLINESLLSVLKKSWVSKLLYDSGAFYVNGILFNPIYKNVVKDTSILENKSDEDKFEAFVKNQKYNDALMRKLIVAGKKIISSVEDNKS